MIFKTMSTMIKVQMLFIVTLTFVMPFIAVHAAHAVTLNPRVTVYDNVITAGDIFDGLSDERQNARVIGAAPQPGQEITLAARSLLRVAMAMDLDWRPVSTAEYTVLKRAASTISREDILARLTDFANIQDGDAAYKITLDRNVQDIHLPHGERAEIHVRAIDKTSASNRFKAYIDVGAQDMDAGQKRSYEVFGMMNRLVEVPVLKGALRKGDVIAPNDIEYKQLMDTEVRGNVIVNIDDLIGKTPRQTIVAGRVIRTNALETPMAIKRGTFVTMVFKNGGLQLSARGKALQNGAVGDTVRVVNTASKKTIEGIVSANGQIEVMTF